MMFNHTLRTLKPIQKLAYQRIVQAQDALAKHGVFPRYATELEFVPLNEKGKPMWNALPIDDFIETFKTSPYISHIAAEGDAPFLTGGKLYRQFEIGINGNGIGRGEALHMSDVRLSPKAITPATDITKHLLRKHSKEYGIAEISFAAKPAEGIFPISSGYHTNISPYNALGENLFGTHKGLWHKAANEMLHSQADGALLMLPNPESFKRIAGSNASTWTSGTPSRVVHTNGKWNNSLEFGTLASRGYDEKWSPVMNRLRDKFSAADQLFRSIADRSPDHNRLENRLAGIDADPYLIAALDTATLQHSVERHVANEGKEIIRLTSLPSFDLPKTIEEAVETFVHSPRMQHLLGEELHSAITAGHTIGMASHLHR